MAGPGRALRLSVHHTATPVDDWLSRLRGHFFSVSGGYPLGGCRDPGLLLDIVAV